MTMSKIHNMLYKGKHGRWKFIGVLDDLSDIEAFQLIPEGKYVLGMPRIWGREICTEDKK